MNRFVSRRKFLKAAGATTLAAAMTLGAPEASANGQKPGALGCDYAQIIIYGQSLASGTESKAALTTEPLDGVYMVGTGAHWYKNDVLTGLYPCKNSGYESPIVAAVNHFADQYHRSVDAGQKFIANSTGLGGRSIERLSKGCTSYEYEYLYKDAFLDYLDSTRSTVQAEGKNVRCIALVWMQGEYNYDGFNKGQGFFSGTDSATDKETYKQYLLQLKRDMQADVMEKYGQSEPPLFFVYQTGGAFITNGTSSINMAQQEVAAECDDVILLGSAMPCPRFNGGHMTSNGYRWQGEMIGKKLTETFLWNDSTRTITDSGITVSGNKVTLNYKVPKPPLVADTYTVQEQPNFGYSVYMDGVGVGISKVNVKRTSVVLTCDQKLHGKVAVKYAGNASGNKEHRGIGNIRDSDGYASLYTYADDTNEVSTLGTAVDYHPRTADGSLLIGRHYPLCNWANHLYREVIADSIPAADFTPKISNPKACAGDILDLNVTYSPENANQDLEISWSISDASKARLEDGRVTILAGGAHEILTLTGTLKNGAQHSVSVELVSNPVESCCAYWDFAGGSRRNTTTVKNLVTQQNEQILVGIDGAESGYLTSDGLTLAADSALMVPVTASMPGGMEIGLELDMPASLFNYNGLRNKAFVSLAGGNANKLECGSEKYGYAWPELRGVSESGKNGSIAWRWETDAGGTELGNTAMWWTAGTMHQQIRLRLNTSGGGEFAMKAVDDSEWLTWKLPTYADADFKYPGFQSIKDACDTIIIGNRPALDGAVPGAVLCKAYIKEYTG